MTIESSHPTLADLQNKWDADFQDGYRRHLRMGFLAALLYLPICLYWLYGIVGWPLTLMSMAMQLTAIPVLAKLPAKLGVGPRPTQQSFEENRSIREAIQRREANPAAGKDDAVEQPANDPR